MAEGVTRFEVGSEQAGTRLDVFLAKVAGLPRSRVRRLLARGLVSLDGRAVGEGAKGRRLEVGARLELEAHEPSLLETPRSQGDMELAILGEGPGWVAVEKPAGAPVHPYEPDESGTVLNALVARRPAIVGVGEGGLRSGVLHRLDLETSGVLLFATREDVWQRLRAAFREHRMEKTYRALVSGRLEGEGRLALDLVTARHRPARVRVVASGEHPPKGGVRRTELRWRSLERFPQATLVEVRPTTGFQHQIRVSLAHLGHPVLGDRTYGEATAPSAPRLLLHAARLRFEEVDVESPDPADFTAFLTRLR